MKIRQKLTLSFTSTVILILIFFGITIYYFSSRYRKNEFYNRLLQRVEITEKMFLEKENLAPQTYELIREQFLNKLPDETEQVFELRDENNSLVTECCPPEFLTKLAGSGEAFFEQNDVQGVGKIFHLPAGDYAVILTARDQIGIRMLTYLRTIIVLTLAGCILTVSLTSYYISSRVLNPISVKIQKANAISARNLHERLNVYNPEDEIGELAIAFNNLLDRVAGAFDAQRSFIDSASHEMRNPLTAIIGEAELALERDRTKNEYIESFQAIAAEANRLNVLVNNLLQLATISYKEVSFKTELIDIHELLVEAKKKFDFSYPENQVQLRFGNDLPRSGMILQGNSHLLQTALINIFDNASKFSFNKVVDVRLRCIQRGKVLIIVQDQGLGIPPEDIPKVTQPFHRAPNVRQIIGSGIGIPLTLKIVELHSGTLEITSQLNRGTEVKITLPILS